MVWKRKYLWNNNAIFDTLGGNSNLNFEDVSLGLYNNKYGMYNVLKCCESSK